MRRAQRRRFVRTATDPVRSGPSSVLLWAFFATTTSCPKCGGTGKIIHQPCSACRGSGSQRKQRKVSINIPAGIDDGQAISLRGQGQIGKNGGPTGDLLVTVNVRPHPKFKRDGTSVLYAMPISFVQAALGDDIEVPTLDGKVKYTIPEGTQTGTVFRLKGKGIPYLKGQRPRGSIRYHKHHSA